MIHSEVYQFARDIPWENAGEGIQRQMFGHDDKVMLVKVKFEAGSIGTLHEHHHSQTTYVASGSFEMTIGDERKIIREGDGYYIPPHVVHGCVCLEPGVLIDCFSPPREDFLV